MKKDLSQCPDAARPCLTQLPATSLRDSGDQRADKCKTNHAGLS